MIISMSMFQNYGLQALDNFNVIKRSCIHIFKHLRSVFFKLLTFGFCQKMKQIVGKSITACMRTAVRVAAHRSAAQKQLCENYCSR